MQEEKRFGIRSRRSCSGVRLTYCSSISVNDRGVDQHSRNTANGKDSIIESTLLSVTTVPESRRHRQGPVPTGSQEQLVRPQIEVGSSVVDWRASQDSAWITGHSEVKTSPRLARSTEPEVGICEGKLTDSGWLKGPQKG